ALVKLGAIRLDQVACGSIADNDLVSGFESAAADLSTLDTQDDHCLLGARGVAKAQPRGHREIEGIARPRGGESFHFDPHRGATASPDGRVLDLNVASLGGWPKIDGHTPIAD